ncbi:MAG: efflux RND transporter periplasmic adaptor subunit [Caulobacteraceae bacterium]
MGETDLPPTPPRKVLLRRHFFLVAAAIALVLMILIGGARLLAGPKKPEGAGGGRGAGGAGRVTQVTPYRVQAMPFTDKIEVLGVAKGRESVTITSGAAELITNVRFRDGQTVSKGQVLVDLQAREQGADVLQAQAAVSLAQSNYSRWKTLYDKGIAAKASLEQYRAALQQAQAGLASARARLGDRVIRAPFSGVVGLTDIAPGALINPGTPIVTLDDTSLIRVDFDVPDRYLTTLREGAQIVAHPDAFPDQAVAGRIAKLDTRIDEKTRAITARAEFPNPGRMLKPGMLMRVTIVQGGRASLAAPESAVQMEGDSAFVFVIANKAGKMVAERRAVRAGSRENGMVELLEGVRAGEIIVSDGVNRVEDGQAVRIGAGRGGGARGGAGRAASAR